MSQQGLLNQGTSSSLSGTGIEEWDITKNYNLKDLVKRDGNIFTSEGENNLGNDPLINTVVWIRVASRNLPSLFGTGVTSQSAISISEVFSVGSEALAFAGVTEYTSPLMRSNNSDKSILGWIESGNIKTMVYDEAGDSWTIPIDVGIPSSSNVLEFDLAISANKALAVWIESDSGVTTCKGSSYDITGDVWTANTTISPALDNVSSPSASIEVNELKGSACFSNISLSAISGSIYTFLGNTWVTNDDISLTPATGHNTILRNSLMTFSDKFVFLYKENVIDQSIIDTINFSNDPLKIKFHPFEKKAYIGGNANNEITIINTIDHSIIGTISLPDSPDGLEVSPDGAKLYVGYTSIHDITVIDTTTNQIIKSFFVDGRVSDFAFIPSLSKIYCSTTNNGRLVIVNSVTDLVKGFIDFTAKTPRGVAISPDGSKAYVTLANIGSVSVIDILTNTEINVITGFTNIQKVVFSQTTDRAYVTDLATNQVLEINTITEVLTGVNINVGIDPIELELSPDDKYLYVSNSGAASISIISIDSLSVVNTVVIPSASTDVTFSPDGTVAYTANEANSSISIIDAANQTLKSISYNIAANTYDAPIIVNGGIGNSVETYSTVSRTLGHVSSTHSSYDISTPHAEYNKFTSAGNVWANVALQNQPIDLLSTSISIKEDESKVFIYNILSDQTSRYAVIIIPSVTIITDESFSPLKEINNLTIDARESGYVIYGSSDKSINSILMDNLTNKAGNFLSISSNGEKPTFTMISSSDGVAAYFCSDFSSILYKRITQESLLAVIGSGRGIIKGKDVSWDAQIVPYQGAALTIQHLLIDLNGSLIVTETIPTNETERNNIILGKFLTNAVGTAYELATNDVSKAEINNNILDFSQSVGPINKNGNNFSYAIGPPRIIKTSGTTFSLSSGSTPDDPNEITLTSQDPLVFQYLFRDGSGKFILNVATTTPDFNNFDDGSGTLASVGNTDFTNQRVFVRVRNILAGNSDVFIFYGQQEYANEDDALMGIANEDFELPAVFFNVYTLRSIITAEGGAAPATARITRASKFGEV